MKKRLSIIIAILAISYTAFAQYFSFTYDAAWNRTDRNVVVLNKSTIVDTTFVNEEPADEDKLHEKLGSFDLAVYRYPTKGEVVVEISGGGLSHPKAEKASNRLLTKFSICPAGKYWHGRQRAAH